MKIKIVKFYTDAHSNRWGNDDNEWVREDVCVDPIESTEWEEISTEDYQLLLEVFQVRKKQRSSTDPHYAIIVQSEKSDKDQPTISDYKTIWKESIEKIKNTERKKELTKAKSAATRAKNKEKKERQLLEDLQKRFNKK